MELSGLTTTFSVKKNESKTSWDCSAADKEGWIIATCAQALKNKKKNKKI